MLSSLSYAYRRYPFHRNFHGFDVPLFIELHLVYAHLPFVGTFTLKRSPVVNDVMFIFSRYAYHGMVSGTGGYFGVLLEYFPYAFEWSERRVGNGVGHTVVGVSPTAFRPYEVIFPMPFHSFIVYRIGVFLFRVSWVCFSKQFVLGDIEYFIIVFSNESALPADSTPGNCACNNAGSNNKMKTNVLLFIFLME